MIYTGRARNINYIYDKLLRWWNFSRRHWFGVLQRKKKDWKGDVVRMTYDQWYREISWFCNILWRLVSVDDNGRFVAFLGHAQQSIFIWHLCGLNFVTRYTIRCAAYSFTTFFLPPFFSDSKRLCCSLFWVGIERCFSIHHIYIWVNYTFYCITVYVENK